MVLSDFVVAFSNVGVLVTLPLHLLLFRALWKMRNSLNSSFHVLVRYISAMSMICCILRLAVELPATHPPLDRAIAFHNPVLEDIVGWLIDLGNISIGLTINMIHAFAAVNRLIAITLPGHYQRMMTAGRTTAFCVSCLLSWIILRLPCLYPVTFMAYEFKNTTTIGYVISDEAVIGLYTVPILLIGVLTTVIIYICYIVIGVKVMWTSIIYNHHLQKSVKKATLAALVSSSGAILAMTVAVVQQVQWMYDQTNFFPVDYYFAYFGFGISLNLSIHPWCLMAIFPDIRKKMFTLKEDKKPLFQSSVSPSAFLKI